MGSKSIKEAVKERFGRTVRQSSSCGCSGKRSGTQSPEFIQTASKAAGYSVDELESVPDGRQPRARLR